FHTSRLLSIPHSFPTRRSSDLLLIEQMKEGAVTLSSTGLIAYCNDSFAALVGKHASQITGSQIEQLILPTDIFHFQNLLRAVKGDRKSTRLNSSHLGISYAVFC